MLWELGGRSLNEEMNTEAFTATRGRYTMDDLTTTDKPKRTPDMVWADIEACLSSMDGIATSDAFKLGKLVKEYGERCAGEAIGDIMKPLMSAMLKKPEPPREPWQGGF